MCVGAGAIVNLGSISWMIGQGGMAAYTACKSPVLGLTRLLGARLRRLRIRVNAVAPAGIMTQRQLEKMGHAGGRGRDHWARQCLKHQLLARGGGEVHRVPRLRRGERVHEPALCGGRRGGCEPEREPERNEDSDGRRKLPEDDRLTRQRNRVLRRRAGGGHPHRHRRSVLP